jgi:hypothetical protein
MRLSTVITLVSLACSRSPYASGSCHGKFCGDRLRMLLNQASAATATSLLDAVSAANTAAATSGSGKWLDVRPYDGELLVTQQIGAVTGSITGKLQSASDANGTGAADITGATFTIVNAANNTQTYALDPKKVVGGFLGYVGTIVTGPALVSVVAAGKKKVV